MLGFLIGFHSVMATLPAALEQAQKEEKAFNDYCATLSDEEAKALQEDRQKWREKARKEAIEERRHKEMCDAIRSTSFWRF